MTRELVTTLAPRPRSCKAVYRPSVTVMVALVPEQNTGTSRKRLLTGESHRGSQSD